MKEYLYLAVQYVARIHDQILMLNDNYSASLSDKQLHFLVIGLFGMLLFFIIHPIFKALIRHGHEIVVSWFYVFTFIIVVSFAIEIGQQISHTGTMSFFDIVYGIGGFLWMFAIFAAVRVVILLIVRLHGKKKRPVREEKPAPRETDAEEQFDGKHLKK